MSYNTKTVDWYAREWLCEAENTLKASTVGRYSSAYEKYIKPSVGDVNCSELTFQQVDELVESCAKYSEKTSALIFSILKLITDFAWKNGCDVHVNLQGYTAIKNKNSELRILQKNEVKRLSTAVLLSPDLTKACIFLCMNTGIRVGELCALKREDIDFDRKILSVKNVMQRVQKLDGNSKTEVTVTELSGRCAQREIPLPEFVINAVGTQFELIKNGCWLSTGESANYVQPRTMENRLKRICDDVGLKDVNFLALRHSFASRCAEIGVDSYALSRILGLSDVTQVVKMYYKNNSVEKDALERLKYV